MTKYGLTKGTHLQTITTIDFSDGYEKNMAILGGEAVKGRKMERILSVVDPLREKAGVEYNFKMMSENDFPTQAGLASSAAGFAALAIAAVDALELNLSQICGPNDFDMNAVVAIIHEGKKDVTSDAGHESVKTSIFNEVRIKKSQEQAEEIRKAILDDDFSKVGKIAEKNCMYMHAVMMTSEPSLFYWHPDTLRVVKTIQKKREEGLESYFTIDAGPNVHVLCRPEDRDEIQKMLGGIKGVDKTIPVEPANDPYVTREHPS